MFIFKPAQNFRTMPVRFVGLESRNWNCAVFNSMNVHFLFFIPLKHHHKNKQTDKANGKSAPNIPLLFRLVPLLNQFGNLALMILIDLFRYGDSANHGFFNHA